MPATVNVNEKIAAG
jgi:antitoxin CcdA